MRGGEDPCAGAVVAGGDGIFEHGHDCKREQGEFGNP
jgi:hypothetical protein